MVLGYLWYVIILFFLTGILILFTDNKAYKYAVMKKEQKVSLFLGWINLSLGFTLMVANWIYQQFFW
ncbi:MAG: hypothetical protein Q8934_16400 [Bacillota bacterium]|nr:hypothetical protein [Bacillota bacterium]